MNEPLCLRCRYFYPEDIDRDGLPDGGEDVYYIHGQCRRRCPVACEPSEDPRRVNYAYWPVVLACDGCGEFEERKRAAQKR